MGSAQCLLQQVPAADCASCDQARYSLSSIPLGTNMTTLCASSSNQSPPLLVQVHPGAPAQAQNSQMTWVTQLFTAAGESSAYLAPPFPSFKSQEVLMWGCLGRGTPVPPAECRQGWQGPAP